MEMLNDQHALVRHRERARYRQAADVELGVAVAELVRERKAARWERLSCWAANRAKRVRKH